MAADIYLQVYVTNKQGEKDLHVKRHEVQDMDAFTDADKAEVLADYAAHCIKKSQGVSCEAAIVTKEQLVQEGFPIDTP